MSKSECHIDVGYVAALARLELDPEALPRLQKDMEAIVQYIELLEELSVDGVEPTAHAVALNNVRRDDVARVKFERDEMLKNAPALVNGETIKVPQVLPGEGMS